MSGSKEKYADSSNVSLQAKTWINTAYKNAGKRKIDVPAGKSALLIVDIQKFFIDEQSHAYVPVGKAIKKNIAELIENLSGKIPIAFSKHVHNLDEDNFPFDLIFKDLLTLQNPLSELVFEANKSRDSIVIEKSTYSAFHQTKLDDWLKNQQIKVLYFAGVTSHLCVETSARHATCLGYFPVILADCTAAWTLNQHLATLTAIAGGIGSLLTKDEMLKNLEDLKLGDTHAGDTHAGGSHA